MAHNERVPDATETAILAMKRVGLDDFAPNARPMHRLPESNCPACGRCRARKRRSESDCTVEDYFRCLLVEHIVPAGFKSGLATKADDGEDRAADQGSGYEPG